MDYELKDLLEVDYLAIDAAVDADMEYVNALRGGLLDAVCVDVPDVSDDLAALFAADLAGVMV